MSLLVSRLERQSSHASVNENAASANSLHRINESRYPPEQHHQESAVSAAPNVIPNAKANRIEPVVLVDEETLEDNSSMDRVENLRRTLKKQSHIPPGSLPANSMLDTNSGYK